jgi:hypothetical protein
LKKQCESVKENKLIDRPLSAWDQESSDIFTNSRVVELT